MKDLELTGRQKLIYEAFQKIHQGEQMQKEGLIELNNLIPPDKTVAHKTVRDGFKKSNLSNDKIAIDRMLLMINKADGVTVGDVRSKLNISDNRIRRLVEKMRQRGLIVENWKNGTKVWAKPDRSPGTKSSTYINPAVHGDAVLSVLKTDGPKTANAVATALKINWTMAKRVLDYLASIKAAKFTEKMNRHTGNMCAYWEVV